MYSGHLYIMDILTGPSSPATVETGVFEPKRQIERYTKNPIENTLKLVFAPLTNPRKVKPVFELYYQVPLKSEILGT